MLDETPEGPLEPEGKGVDTDADADASVLGAFEDVGAGAEPGTPEAEEGAEDGEPSAPEGEDGAEDGAALDGTPEAGAEPPFAATHAGSTAPGVAAPGPSEIATQPGRYFNMTSELSSSGRGFGAEQAFI